MILFFSYFSIFAMDRNMRNISIIVNLLVLGVVITPSR